MSQPNPHSEDRRRKRARLLAWSGAWAWAGVIFAGSSVPGSRIPGNFSYVGHLGEYFVLGALLYIALRVDSPPRRALVLAVALASGYGASDEFHQRFVAMRTPDVADWALDTVGALLGSLLAHVSLAHVRRSIGRRGRG